MHEATAKQATLGGGDELALRRVRDRAEVEELLIRYTMSVDLRDWTPFQSCFAERVRVRFDPPLAEAPEEPLTPEEWAPFAGSFLGDARAPQHYYSIDSIRLEGNEAEAIMYYRAGHGEHVDDPPFLHTAYSTFQCRRTAEGWKITEISTHTVADALEQGYERSAPASETRPRHRARNTTKRHGTKRSAAKRRQAG